MSILADNTGDDNPDILDVLDRQRLFDISRQADLAVNLWGSLLLAAQRGDERTMRMHCHQLSALTRATFHLVKRLGEVTPDD